MMNDRVKFIYYYMRAKNCWGYIWKQRFNENIEMLADDRELLKELCAGVGEWTFDDYRSIRVKWATIKDKKFNLIRGIRIKM